MQRTWQPVHRLILPQVASRLGNLVAVGVLNRLLDGVLGELGGSLFFAGSTAARNFKTLIRSAGSYTVNDVVEQLDGKTLKQAVKEAFSSELASHAVEGLGEIVPFSGVFQRSPRNPVLLPSYTSVAAAAQGTRQPNAISYSPTGICGRRPDPSGTAEP